MPATSPPRSRLSGVRLFSALLILVPLGPRPLSAQQPESPLVRSGTFRLEVTPAHHWWDSRFGERSGAGGTVSAREPLGYDLSSDVLGTAMVPSLATFQERIRSLLDDEAYLLDLGLTRTTWSHSQTRLPIRLDIGVTDWLTVSGTLPLIRTEAQIDVSLRADSTTANAGLNPAAGDAGSVNAFLNALDADLASFEATTTALCGELGDAAPECADARALLAEGQSLNAGLEDLYLDADAYFPLGGSEAGRGLEARVDSLRAGLASFGDTASFGSVPLSQTPLDAEAFNRIVTDAAYGVAGAPLAPFVFSWELGDVELGAALRLLRGRGSGDPRSPGLRYQLGVEGVVRLPTGTAADPDVFQSLPSGGTGGVRLRAFGSVQSGRRWGLWGHVALVRPQAQDVTRRVSSPEVVLAPAASRALVRWTPGNTVDLYAAPRFALSPGLAVYLPYRFLRKGSDSYSLPGGGAGPPPGAPEGTPDVSVLDEESSVTLHRLGLGVIYSTLPAFRDDDSSLPVELRASWQTAIGGSGGHTPVLNSFTVTFRLLLSFWGRGA